MAIKKVYTSSAFKKRLLVVLLAAMLLPFGFLIAQNPFTFNIKNGKMHIAISKKITAEQIENYVYKYKLQPLFLQQLITQNFTDSIKAQGWIIEVNNDTLVQLSKAFLPADVLAPISSKTFISPLITNSSLINNTFFVNKLKSGVPYKETKTTFTFVLPGFQKAKKVLLAASFTNWQANALPMQLVDKTWQITIVLKEGKHAYKFIVDDEWIIDPNNYNTESDGEGNTNSLICKSNTNFSLQGYSNARKIFVAGSFNNWEEKRLYLYKTDTGWQLPMFLKDGTYTYRFVVDGKWIEDPTNPNKFKNEFYNQYNSVVSIGKPTVFTLKGFENAKHVTLLGSFNAFKAYEIEMQKNKNAWQVSYVLANGNYTYCFKVDDKLVNQNGIEINNPNKGTVVLANPNHTFTLRGFTKARSIYVTGSFNNWNETAVPMLFINNQWVAKAYLPLGKNTYKFIVDGEWIIDPSNKLWENNEHNTGNSVIWKEE